MSHMEQFSKIKAVILAGGQGTRVRSVVADRPKPLAEVMGQPFLKYLLDQLAIWGGYDVVLSTGYLGEQIKVRFGERYNSLCLHYVQEPRPLGTGGALRFALPILTSETILVMNGDSYCHADLAAFYRWHCLRKSDATLLLMLKDDTKRYGTVQVDADGRITEFTEKDQGAGPALINAGISFLSAVFLSQFQKGAPSR